MLPTIRVYITYSDVYNIPPSLDEISKFFSKFHTAHLIQAISKLNIALWKNPVDPILHGKLARLYFPPEDLPKLSAAIGKYKGSYPYIFHRHQALLALKLILLNPNMEGERNIDLKQLGRYLLALSYYFENAENPPVLPIVTLNFEYARRAIAKLNYFSHYGDFGHNYSRAIEMWLNIPRTTRGKKIYDQFKIDVQKEFLEEVGLTIEEFITCSFLMLNHLIALDVSTNNPRDFMLFSDFFSQTKLTQEKQNKLYSYLRQDIMDFKSNYEKSILEKLRGKDLFDRNFLPLVEYPILKINDQMSIVSDPQYIQERVVQAPYWILLNKFAKLNEYTTGRGRLLSSYYGLLHHEYVYQSLLKICDQVIEVPSSNIEKRADFIGITKLKEAIYLFVIDAKKIMLPLPLVLDATKEDTVKKLKEVFFDEGFRQIFNTINKIEKNETNDLGLQNLNLRKVAGIFPLLITDRFIAEESLNRKFYEDVFFEPLYQEQPFLKETPVSHPMFISSDELDKIEAIVEKGSNVDFPYILAARNIALNKRFDIPETNQFIPHMTITGVKGAIENLDTFWNFLFRIKPGKYKNKRLGRIIMKHSKKAKKLLFGSIYLLGIDHKLQWDRSLNSTKKMLSYIKRKVKKEAITVIGEEFFPEIFSVDTFYITKNISTTTIKDFAIKNNLKHIYCDANYTERKTLKVRDPYEIRAAAKIRLSKQEKDFTKEEHEAYHAERKHDDDIREQFWLGKLQQDKRENILFICGKQHLKSFQEKLKANDFNAIKLKVIFDNIEE